jgi:E3 ubiquitin-protein ligase RNF216
LGEEFPDIPVKHIQAILRADTTLFKAFHTLDAQLRNYDPAKDNPFSKVRNRTKRTRTKTPADMTKDHLLTDLWKEVQAAKKKREKEDGRFFLSSLFHQSQRGFRSPYTFSTMN